MLPRCDALQNADLGRMAQRLINNAVTLSQSNQVRPLLFTRVGVQVEMQSNLLETNGHVFGDAKRSAKVQIALRLNPGVA